jgi:hypothetical protein
MLKHPKAEQPKSREVIDLQRGHLSPDHELWGNLHWSFSLRIETVRITNARRESEPSDLERGCMVKDHEFWEKSLWERTRRRKV